MDQGQTPKGHGSRVFTSPNATSMPDARPVRITTLSCPADEHTDITVALVV